ncbi:radical SAM protein [Bacteroidota bacterium]
MYTALNYSEPIFRPPSEAYSLILQATFGCSWNKCAFCEMYTSKKFKVKDPDVFEKEVKTVAESAPDIRKIFLADGNAVVLSFRKLKHILEIINKYFPKLSRISAYALPGDLISKTDAELKELRELGLKLIYVGIESGDDELLKLINKSETFDSTVEGLLKSKAAGIKSSVMILNGLGGQKYSDQHAVNSARLINKINPEFLSTLVLSFPYGEEHYRKRFLGEYIPMNIELLLAELGLFLHNTELNNVVFRSDHASNYLALKGILGRDKESLLRKIKGAIEDPENAHLRPEWMRGL